MSDQFRFIKFQKSKSRFSKYDAIIEDIKTRRRQKVPFGDKRYEQYKDTTGLKIYSHLDHNNLKRRDNYLKRHASTMKRKWSASYFSARFLWNWDGS